jgi:hypothetical protein
MRKFPMSDPKIEGNRKLLQLAGYLEARSELGKNIDLKPYDQKRFIHDCGSPGCAAGMWVFMNPDKYRIVNPAILRSDGVGISTMDIRQDFYLSYGEYTDLFGTDGCNQATNEFAAATYIRRFVRYRGGVPNDLQLTIEPKENVDATV